MEKKKVPAALAAPNMDVSATQDEKRRPIDTVRIGDVSASVWARDAVVKGEERRFFSCTFERSYKDRDGSYRYTKTFDRDTLGTLVAVLQKTEERLAQLDEGEHEKALAAK